MNPYLITEPATINFSGGRSSGFLLYHILDAHDGALPENVCVVFCNTGKERPETLDFVARCQAEWNVPIRWLEYRYRTDATGGLRDPKNTFVEVNHNSASRNGEPFEQIIRNYLPNPTRRTCTAELKVSTIERFMRAEYGWKKDDYKNVLGIRYDEKKRWGRLLYTDCRVIMPMVDAKQSRSGIYNFWRDQSFDLGIPSSRGNCDLCFLKTRTNLIETIREDPSLADWWIEQERKTADRRQLPKGVEDACFRRGVTYDDLRAKALGPSTPSLFGDETAYEECYCTD